MITFVISINYDGHFCSQTQFLRQNSALCSVSVCTSCISTIKSNSRNKEQIGAIIGAFILRGALGMPKEDLVVMPGCYVDSSIVSPGQAFGLEFMSSFFQLFLAFGLGLDPRNNSSFGPSLTPFLIGLSAALTLFSTGLTRPGYLGASTNPARCLGLMAAAENFTYHYNHWFADITAVM
jgi:glycerol uptake facilitator-like aquaporin